VVQCGLMWSDAVRCGLMRSDVVISHTPDHCSGSTEYRHFGPRTLRHH